MIFGRFGDDASPEWSPTTAINVMDATTAEINAGKAQFSPQVYQTAPEVDWAAAEQRETPEQLYPVANIAPQSTSGETAKALVVGVAALVGAGLVFKLLLAS